MNNFEFVCRIINPSCELRYPATGCYVAWVVTPEPEPLLGGAFGFQKVNRGQTSKCDTPQAAWQAAFALLDRRKREQDRRKVDA